MTDPNPNLLILLEWSHRQAMGRPCADWVAWCATEPNAAKQWEQIGLAEEQLDGGSAPKGAVELGATDVAEYLDGKLTPAAARQVDEACWRSPAQLCELASAARFCRESKDLAEVSTGLTSRLLALGPQVKKPARAVAFRLAAAAPPRAEADHLAEPVVVKSRLPAARHSADVFRGWPLVIASAVLIAAVVGGTLAWLAAISLYQPRNLPPMAGDAPSELPAPNRPDVPLENRFVTPAPEHVVPAPLPESKPPAIKSTDVPSTLAANDPSPPVAPNDAHWPRPLSPPAAAATAPKDVTIQSAIGALLVDAGNRGRLTVAQEKYTLAQPLRLVSLAESWSSVEIPDVGTLICEGPVEATIASWGDGVLEIELAHGKLGLQGLPAGAQVRFQTGGAQWEARGQGNYSTLAVVHDPATPSLFVPTGTAVVDDVAVDAQQIVRFFEGIAQPPQALAANVSPAVDDPLAGRWLSPPDDARRKRWQAVNGKLLESLSAAEDAGAELPKLFAATRDPRQAALLARWNVSVITDAERAAHVWVMLTDRREAVRVAAVRYLVELPAGDQRLVNSVRFVRLQAGNATGDRVAQWLAAAKQPGQIPVNQAAELAESLSHRELAVRQLAVSLLELHAAPALTKARRMPPAYDAAAPSAKRAAAQREWRQMLRQLFTPARNAAAAALAPNAAAKQPAIAPQNAAPQNAGPQKNVPAP